MNRFHSQHRSSYQVTPISQAPDKRLKLNKLCFNKCFIFYAFVFDYVRRKARLDNFFQLYFVPILDLLKRMLFGYFLIVPLPVPEHRHFLVAKYYITIPAVKNGLIRFNI